MDERRPRTSVATASFDTELANIAVPPSGRLSQQAVIVDSTLVYCGNPESVREGFGWR